MCSLRSCWHWPTKSRPVKLQRDTYTCLAGKTITTTGHISTDHGTRYLASVPECRACPLKAIRILVLVKRGLPTIPKLRSARQGISL